MRSPKARNGRKEANIGERFARGKKAKFPATRPEPECFADNRSLEDLWKAAFPVGTEWHNIDSVYKFNWDFSNLEGAFEENGVLCGKKVYLFGCTEPQLVFFNDSHSKIVFTPVVVAVTSPFPPSDKVGISSVQMEGEAVVPMKQMKMDWVPYIPFEDRHRRLESLKSQIYTMQCSQRRAALKQLKEEEIKKYEYCIPYFDPPLEEDGIEQGIRFYKFYPVKTPGTPALSNVKVPFINRYYGKAHAVL